MLTETFVTSVYAQPKSANTAIKKDVGIFQHELHPSHVVKSSFKKSSTPVNALAVSPTHIFAAQAEKAVLHVYSRERGNQEALISFPERINTLTLIGDGVLVLGTVEGRLILWEVGTGRQVSTPASHLQAVSCLAAKGPHLASGSDDSNIHIWSIPRLLSLVTTESHESLRTLSNHRAAITSLAMGHSSSTTNIAVSASKDNTVIIWNYHSGDLLRTFLLHSTPLCLALDPCDRGVFVGHEDGAIHLIEFLQKGFMQNTLFDSSLQTTPVQVTNPAWTAPSEIGSVLCLGLTYDSTNLLSGHTSGKVAQWDTGRKMFAAELTDLNSPVTNLEVLPPLPKTRLSRLATVVKPKLGEGPYTFTAQFSGNIEVNHFQQVVETPGFASDFLEDAIHRFTRRVGSGSSVGDEKLRKENEELWKVVKEQRALQQKTWEKYNKLKTDGV